MKKVCLFLLSILSIGLVGSAFGVDWNDWRKFYYKSTWPLKQRAMNWGLYKHRGQFIPTTKEEFLENVRKNDDTKYDSLEDVLSSKFFNKESGKDVFFGKNNSHYWLNSSDYFGKRVFKAVTKDEAGITPKGKVVGALSVAILASSPFLIKKAVDYYRSKQSPEAAQNSNSEQNTATKEETLKNDIVVTNQESVVQPVEKAAEVVAANTELTAPAAVAPKKNDQSPGSRLKRPALQRSRLTRRSNRGA